MTETDRNVLEKLADAMEASGDTRRARLIRLGLSGAPPTTEQLAEVYPPHFAAAADEAGAGIVSVAMLDLGKIAQAAIGTAGTGLPTDLLQELQGFAGDLTQRLVRGAAGDTFSLFVARGALGTMIGPENPDALSVFDHLSQYVAGSASRLGAPARQSALSWLDFVAKGRAFALLRDEVAPRVTRNDDRDAHNALAVRLGDHAKAFLESIDLPKRIDAYLESQPKPLADDPGELASTMEEDGILFLDELFARDLESIGDTGKTAAKHLRKSARERMEAFRESDRAAKLWEAWNLPASGAEWEGTTSPRWIVTLARVLWLDVVGPALERQSEARPFRLEAVRGSDSDRYVTQPKIVAPISWAMGAPGMRAVTLDGDRYAPEPNMAARLVPRSFPLLAELEGHERKPHQTILALEHEEPIALPVAVAGATNYAISPVAAKLALVMLAAEDVKRGRLLRVSLGELARWVHPNATRLQARELQATSRALDELRLVFLFLPDGRKAQMFETVSAAVPELARADMEITWGLARTFLAALAQDIRGPKLKGSEYRGDFLVNLDGAMRIPAKRPALLRHYIRAAAHWNAAFKPGSPGTFDPAMTPAYSAKEWATITNSLPPGVVEYLNAQGKRAKGTSTGRAQWSKERKGMLADLAELEAMGLVEVQMEGRGQNERFKLLPSAAHLEAKAQAQAEGRRPERDPKG